ncbi:MAG TPA: DUF2974 domain-containing protein [Clostridiales bacterium]|nr:DUF2974 domain-containing protein [Clostridiales bacterium]
MNIIDYAETQMERFESAGFNLVDSLVLSQFVYINLNGIVPGLTDSGTPVRIGDLLKAEIIPHMLENVRDPKSNHRLLLALGMSPRFRDIRMYGFSDTLSITEQKQFAAVTFLLDDKTAYIAYRGTDATIAGWKENFNMAFIYPVPAQQEGAAYMNAVAERFPHHALMAGGHSKGGNIAVYSAMECDPAVQDRIVGIYSHDGPGFKDEIFTSEKYANIKSKIHKTLPQSSLIGMLLQHHEDYVVVESRQFWIMQHDPFSWVVSNGDFQYRQGITGGAKHIDTVINQWIASLDDEKRELFVTTIYKVIESMGVVKFSDFNGDWYKKAVSAMETIRGIDTETRRFVLATIRSLLALYVKSLKLSIRDRGTLQQEQ